MTKSAIQMADKHMTKYSVSLEITEIGIIVTGRDRLNTSEWLRFKNLTIPSHGEGVEQ